MSAIKQGFDRRRELTGPTWTYYNSMGSVWASLWIFKFLWWWWLVVKGLDSFSHQAAIRRCFPSSQVQTVCLRVLAFDLVMPSEDLRMFCISSIRSTMILLVALIGFTRFRLFVGQLIINICNVSFCIFQAIFYELMFVDWQVS